MTSGRLREVKNKRKLQTVISKSGRDRLQDVVTYERKSGRLREVVARTGSTVFHFHLFIR